MGEGPGLETNEVHKYGSAKQENELELGELFMSGSDDCGLIMWALSDEESDSAQLGA